RRTRRRARRGPISVRRRSETTSSGSPRQSPTTPARAVSRPLSSGLRKVSAATGNTNDSPTDPVASAFRRKDDYEGHLIMKQILLTLTILALTVNTAAAQNPISDGIRSQWNGVKRNISESAEQMPEANYAFKPVDT